MLADINKIMKNNNIIEINNNMDSSAVFPQDHILLPLHPHGNNYLNRQEQFQNNRKSSIEQYYTNDIPEVNYFNDEIYENPMSNNNNNNSNFQGQQYKQEIEQDEEEFPQRKYKQSECSTNAQSASIAPSSSYISPLVGQNIYPLDNFDFTAMHGNNNYLEQQQFKLSQIGEFELENHNHNPMCTCAFNHTQNPGWKSLDASFELAKDDIHVKNYDFHDHHLQQNQKHIGIEIPDHIEIINSSPLLSGEINNKNQEIFSGQIHPADQFGTAHNQHCYSNQDSSYQDNVNYSFDYYSYFKANEEDLLEKPLKNYKVKNSIIPIISEEERLKRRAEYCDMMRIRNNQRTGGSSMIQLNQGEVAAKHMEEEMEVDGKDITKNNLDQQLASPEKQSLDKDLEMKDKQTLILEESTTKKQEQPLAIQPNLHMSEEDTLISIDDMKLCNKKNVVKNIMNAFKNFILEAELKNTPKVNQKLVSLYNSRKIADEDDDTLPEIIKKFKRYINSKNFNHYSMRLLIIHVNYGPVLRYFLQGPIFEWAKTCKANDLAAHFVMVDFLLLSFADIKHLDQLKRHEKKKAHYQ